MGHKMMWLSFTLTALLIVFVLDYIKNVYKTELLLEQLFDNFLRIESRATYAEHELYQILAQKLGKAFFSSDILLYIRAREKFLLKHQHMPHPKWKNLLRHNLALQEKPAILGNELSHGILSENYYTLYFRRKAFKTIIIPVRDNNNKKPLGFIVFFYFSPLQYLRALKYLKLNASKLHDFLKHLFLIMREYTMNFKNITINYIKDYAVIVTDTNCHITYTNQGALFLLGLSNENEITNKSFLSFIDNESLDHFTNILSKIQTVSETKTHLSLISSLAPDKRIRTQAFIKAITLEDDFMGLYILLHDITNDEILIQNMKRLSAVANSLFNHSRDAIFQISSDKHIIRSNQAAQQLCQKDMPIIGFDFTTLFPPETQTILNQLLEESITTKSFQLHPEVKLGKRWYNIRTFPVIFDDIYDSSIISFVDITDIKLHEEKLKTITKQMIDDLNAARTLQYELLPSTLPSCKKVCYQHLFRPCEEFGGDFYYVEEITVNGKPYHLILVADVAGHGISAAMLTVLVKDVYTSFRNSIHNQTDLYPNRFLEMLNERLTNLEMYSMAFVTAYMAVLSLENGNFLYSSGGMPFTIHLRRNESIQFLGIEKSPPAGFQTHFAYQYKEVTLEPEDRIIIYTDGIDDLLSIYNTYMNNIILENRNKTLTAIRDTLAKKVEDFYSSKHHEHIHQDDITVIMFEIQKE